MINLDEIERIAREATPGPWFVGEHFSERLAITGQPQPADNPRFVHNGRGNLADDVEPNDAAHIATMSPAATLDLVAELRAARDDERIPRLEFRASLAEHQRNDALARIRELETQLAEADSLIGELMAGCDGWMHPDEIARLEAESVARHREREGK